MIDISASISFSREDWRLFFQGQFHQSISLTLSEAYSKIFKFCFDLGLLSDPHNSVASVSYLDVNDLSDTTKLVYLRHSSILKNASGAVRDCTLYQMLNLYFRENRANTSPNKNSELKTMLRLCKELENISNTLKMGRNINAHMQNEILDTGFTLQICSTVLRLYEIFDYERVSASNIDQLRSQAYSVIIGGTDQGSYKTKDESLVDQPFDNSPAKFHPPSDQAEVHSVSQSEIPEEIDGEVEVPLDGNVRSVELQRQKLHKIKLEIYSFLQAEVTTFDRKMTLLYGSNLSDILAVEPKTIDNLKRVLSVKILMARNNELIDRQIARFGNKIVDVFK
jgi:hypothetical protein